MLQNAYFLAKIGADTAENEQQFAEVAAARGQELAVPRQERAVRRYKGLGLAKLGKLANFWRARSRLYQNEILQENMRLTAFFKIYKICILLHRCNLKILAKNRFAKSAIFVKIQQKFCKI